MSSLRSLCSKVPLFNDGLYINSKIFALEVLFNSPFLIMIFLASAFLYPPGDICLMRKSLNIMVKVLSACQFVCQLILYHPLPTSFCLLGYERKCDSVVLLPLYYSRLYELLGEYLPGLMKKEILLFGKNQLNKLICYKREAIASFFIWQINTY